jgi:hypothetical protein
MQCNARARAPLVQSFARTNAARPAEFISSHWNGMEYRIRMHVALYSQEHNASSWLSVGKYSSTTWHWHAWGRSAYSWPLHLISLALVPDRLINALYCSTSSIPARTKRLMFSAYRLRGVQQHQLIRFRSQHIQSFAGLHASGFLLFLHCRSTSKTINGRLSFVAPLFSPFWETGRMDSDTDISSHLILSTRNLDGFQLSGKSFRSDGGRRDRRFQCMCIVHADRWTPAPASRVPDKYLLNVRKTKRNSKKHDTGGVDLGAAFFFIFFLFFPTNILQIFLQCRRS